MLTLLSTNLHPHYTMEEPKLLETILAQIGDNRKSKGYSAQYMADKMYMSKDSYRALEKGRVAMTLERFVQITQVLEEDPSTFFQTCWVKAGGPALKNMDNYFNEWRG